MLGGDRIGVGEGGLGGCQVIVGLMIRIGVGWATSTEGWIGLVKIIRG